MASKKKESKTTKQLEEIKEPSILIRPINRLGGLDNIHVALIALVAILILLLLAISYSKPITIRNVTTSNCTYTSASGTCITPIHNATQIKDVAEQILASYSNTNSSYYLLSYLTNVSEMSEYYVPGVHSWLVTVPSTNPTNNQTFYLSFLIDDNDTAAYTPYYSLPLPSVLSDNKVVAEGVVQIAGKPYCSTRSPLQMYWFVDPYAPGSMQSLVSMVDMQTENGKKLNATLKILYGSSTQAIANQVGSSNADALGKYLLCASTQPKFNDYVYAVNSVYNGGYVSPNTLQSIATSSGINSTSLNNCLGTVDGVINAQALLANFYNISATPTVVTDCEYLSLPQSANKAACYANSTLC